MRLITDHSGLCTLRVLAVFLLFCLSATAASTDQTRRAPPPGIAVPTDARAELERGLSDLNKRIAELRIELRDKPALRELLPDIEIFHKAVQWPLLYSEFFRSNEFATARSLLRQGSDRAFALLQGRAPWLTATGLVIRAYISKIDGSVQPYGLVVPAAFRKDSPRPNRIDIWLHGRDDHLTELKFISDRQRAPGEFTPPDAFVLHPYGRYCNAFKFAGEVDVFEAMEHVRKNYPIDGQRLAIRGFSMGGAGCWHLAAHHPGVWAAANPGAGFVETAEYTQALRKDPKPAWFEQALWHLYDSVDYAENIFNCPTVAYSGEIDKQKQAADMMAAAMKRERLELTHVIGPNTAHKYEPKAKLEVARRVDDLVARGKDPLPREIRFTTWTLRYNTCDWLSIDQMGKHWERARVEARIDAPNLIHISTTNVEQLTLSLPQQKGLMDGKRMKLTIDGQSLNAPVSASEDISKIHLYRFINSYPKGKPYSWGIRATDKQSDSLTKRPGLQGPIDDAFMDRFIFVRPTGEPLNQEVGQWVAAELAKATNEWRTQFRGDALVKNDAEITDADIASANLILWGDSQSNKLLGRMASKLPFTWTKDQVRFSRQPSAVSSSITHVPVLIYPNPLNPEHYIVLNSGFTFAGAAGASNAQQTPKLPDYALLNISAESSPRIVQAGFFDEFWKFGPSSK